MQPVNKLQCHTLISCCCYILVSPSLSTCDFVGSSLKTSEVSTSRSMASLMDIQLECVHVEQQQEPGMQRSQ